jgi:hypothetical protein
MSSEHWSDEGEAAPPAEHAKPPTTFRVWLERISLGLLTVFAIGVPLVIGLMFYLALTDGIVVNANDPLQETRIWMVRERTGATGIGLTMASPTSGTNGLMCARTKVLFLKWDRRIRIESDASYCRCYSVVNGQLVENQSAACQP